MNKTRQQPSGLAAVLIGSAAVAMLAGALPGGACAQDTRWNLQLSTGIDTYLNKYYLAEDDTTDAVAEYNVAATLEGRSARRTTHQWHLRTDFSYGTELLRELLDASYRWRPGAGDPRLRLDLVGYGRQYRRDTSYSLSSDNLEGRVGLRAYPWYTRRTVLDLRADARLLDYATPSTLEQDYHQLRYGAFLRSRDDFERNWRVGAQIGARSYPDSAAIDRDFYVIEGDYNRTGDDLDLHAYQRSERRLVADETARPSAWSHWTELNLALPAGQGRVVVEATSEIWNYDQEYGAYYDSWRLDGGLGYRWGDVLGPTWKLLMAVENLSAGDSPEAYTQASLHGSFESYAYPFTGVISLGWGQRWYTDQGAAGDELDDLYDVTLDYSDFSYLEIWIMANWSLSEHFALDLIANYQPESHTEQTDDMTVGYGSLRLVWRP